ncbi:MAG: serine protease, partial [Pseudomonadota bacterium]
PAARVWTGTGFLAGDPVRIVTNHHVAIPWTSDPASLAVAPQGLEPVPLRFEAFLPGLDQPMAMETVALDEAADLALLAPSDGAAFDRPALPLGRDGPRVGQAAVAIGFPTGLRAMLARAGPEMLAEIRETGADDDRSVAMELAARDLIEPLVTVGVVAQSSAGAVVFDAATTRGGSGGPLLSLTGDVTGVQSAILSDFSGSNLAVPAARLRALLASAE